MGSLFLSFIKPLWNWLKPQQIIQLVALVFIPCVTVTTYAMLAANFSHYLVAFVVIILLMLCIYVVVAIKQKADFQIRTLSNLIEALIDGDYSLRGKVLTNQAFQELLTLINELAQTLSKHKTEARESKMLLERVMEQMNAIIIATDENNRIVIANVAAQRMLGKDSQSLMGEELQTVDIGREMLVSPAGIIEFTDAGLKDEYLLFKEHFLSDGKRHQLFLMTNAERLLMEKERNAWQSLLRVLSHEMNNSLAPISAISESMKKRIDKIDNKTQREDLFAGVAIINERADSLSSFISSYSHLTHLPLPDKTDCKLEKILGSIKVLFPHCEITIDKSCKLIVHADRQQLEQVFINVLKNAAEAMENSTDSLITICCHTHRQHIDIIIEDFGTGITNPDNIFVPFYSTKQQGSGIGLALCRQIMFNHHGSMSVQNKDTKDGCKVILTFPYN